MKIEGKEEDTGIVRQPKPAAIRDCLALVEKKRIGDPTDWDGRNGRNRRPRKLRRHPDFVVVIEGGMPPHGKMFLLPIPEADVVTPGKETRPHVAIEPARIIKRECHQIDAIRI